MAAVHPHVCTLQNPDHDPPWSQNFMNAHSSWSYCIQTNSPHAVRSLRLVGTWRPFQEPALPFFAAAGTASLRSHAQTGPKIKFHRKQMRLRGQKRRKTGKM